MNDRRRFAMLLGLVVLPACDAAVPVDGGDPVEVKGTCHARVDGATVDIVDVEDIAASASMSGSTLSLSCGQNTHQGTVTTFHTPIAFTIKAFDGVGDYTVDDTGTYGDATYAGNDDNRYETFKPSTGGLDSSCTLSVTEADKKHVAGTFTCTNLMAFINDAHGACCDSIYVNLSEGSFNLPFDE